MRIVETLETLLGQRPDMHAVLRAVVRVRTRRILLRHSRCWGKGGFLSSRQGESPAHTVKTLEMSRREPDVSGSPSSPQGEGSTHNVETLKMPRGEGPM